MSFDLLAPHYRWLEAAIAGPVLQRARLTHVAALDAATEILLVGEGPGRFLRALRQRRPTASLTVLDLSAAMLRRARARDPHPAHTTYIQADLRTWTPPAARWDAIVTCCVLDCFAPSSLATVIARLALAAKPDTVWLNTDFAVPRRPGWRRLRARGAHALMYGVFRIVTGLEARRLTPPDPALQAAGFSLFDRKTHNHGLLQADHWVRAAQKSIETCPPLRAEKPL